jgi:TPP-dependent trihydroxycyclohexane-1,2-dione (THcHDO) dehydratase
MRASKLTNVYVKWLIARAKRPLLLVGGGIHLSQAHSALQAFAEDQ